MDWPQSHAHWTAGLNAVLLAELGLGVAVPVLRVVMRARRTNQAED